MTKEKLTKANEISNNILMISKTIDLLDSENWSCLRVRTPEGSYIPLTDPGLLSDIKDLLYERHNELVEKFKWL